MIYFISDTHFYHYKEFLNRPFLGPEMDELLISNWNSIVQPKDSVWHLGDFGFTRNVEDAEKVFNRLNGDKHLVKGNHDQNNKVTQSKLRWGSIHDVKMLSFENDHFFLSHYAHRTWPSKYHGVYHLYGHSHGNMPGFDRSMDVGVDASQYKEKYKPISAVEVISQLGSIKFEGKYD
jgi:calcineurin-like phosphoesterase family protein